MNGPAEESKAGLTYRDGFLDGFQAGLMEGRKEKRIADNPYLSWEEQAKMIREAQRQREEMFKWHPPLTFDARPAERLTGTPETPLGWAESILRRMEQVI